MVTTQCSLLLRLRTRSDSDAWRSFVELYGPMIQRWISRLGIAPQFHDDLLQDILIVLIDHLKKFSRQRPGSFRAWLRTITQNKARDWLRKHKHLANMMPLAEIEISVADPVLWMSEQEYRESLVGSALKAMQKSFSKTTWQAAWLHVALDQPAAEVARQLGISENAVYLARGRVLKRLRQELDGLWE